MKKLLLLCVIMSVCLFGCGSETSGTLTVSAPTSSNGVVTAVAKFTPSSGAALQGQDIDFRWYTVGVDSKVKSAESSKPGKTDSTGSVTSQFTLPASRSEDYNVYVIASTGGLTNKEGWQSVTVLK
jgi:hypothetical protein